MKMRYIYVLLTFSFISTLFVSCSDLEEEIYSETVVENFYNNKEEIIGAYTRPWAHTQWVLPLTIFKLNELSADAAVTPTKSDGSNYSDGIYIALHEHKWTSEHPTIDEAWAITWEGIGFVNGVLEGIEPVDFEEKQVPISKAEMTAELRCLRAYWHMVACDLWGNVPITTKVSDPAYPATNTRKEVYEFIETELIATIDDLPVKKHAETYGYFTKAGAKTLLARLYLNSKVYADVEEYALCVDMCNEVILAANYELDENWQDPFLPTNEFSKENIFAFALDGVTGWSYNISAFTLPNVLKNKFGLQFDPFNEMYTVEEFYDSYNDLDNRKEQYLVGPQYGSDLNTPLVIIDKHIASITDAGLEEGARNYKHVFGENSQGHIHESDLVVLRYTDVILMKAEALMRQNGGVATQEAVDLVNQVRKRAFGDNFGSNKFTTTNLTMDELLAERGREFAYEGQRRTDLIRFGKFTGTRWAKDNVSEDYRTLFPIPLKQTNINPNLDQNPNY